MQHRSVDSAVNMQFQDAEAEVSGLCQVLPSAGSAIRPREGQRHKVFEPRPCLHHEYQPNPSSWNKMTGCEHLNIIDIDNGRFYSLVLMSIMLTLTSSTSISLIQWFN